MLSLSLPTRLLAYIGYGFLVAPSLVIIPMSFSDSREFVFPPPRYSLRLYREFLLDAEWLRASGLSFIVALGTTVLSLALGLLAAYVIERRAVPGRTLVIGIAVAPIFLPAVVTAVGLSLLFHDLGLQGTVPGLVMAHSLFCIPFVIVLLRAAVRQLDADLETAARVMGASWRGVVLRVVLPLLFPALASAATLSLLMSFDEIVVSWFITGVGAPTLPVKMYTAVQWENSPAIPVVSTLLTLLSLVICLLSLWLQRMQKKTRS